MNLRKWNSLPTEVKAGYEAAGVSVLIAVGWDVVAKRAAEAHNYGFMTVADVGVAAGLLLGAYFTNEARRPREDHSAQDIHDQGQAPYAEFYQDPEIGRIPMLPYDSSGPRYDL